VLNDVLYEKAMSADSTSDEWAKAGQHLLDYVRQRPEYLGRYRALGRYLASKILVANLRRRDFKTVREDVRRFRTAGLIDGDWLAVWRNHRRVRRYRRQMASAAALAHLTGAPESWR
jgi:hypothetical protein